jgi:4'-phosphopantetheinyl transferase
MIALLAAAADEVPEGDGWLVGSEPAILTTLRVPGRRTQWRLGRWTAKAAVAAVLGIPAGAVEVRAAADGAPEAWHRGMPLRASISISHRAGWAVCAVASPPSAVGCDLELVEPRAAVFADEWFTAAELQLVDSAPADEHDLLVTVVWSAKESALKLRRCGLRGDPRRVDVSPRAERVRGWRALDVRDDETGLRMDAWWMRLDRMVLTVAACVPEPPVWLRRSELLARRLHQRAVEEPHPPAEGDDASAMSG